jgi:translation initiation factor IF-2
VAKHTRVYQVAKEHRLSSEVLMGILPQMGIEVKRHTDRLEDTQLDTVAAWFAKYPDGIATDEPVVEVVAAPVPPEETAVATQPAPTDEPVESPAPADEPVESPAPVTSEEPETKAPEIVMPPTEPVVTQVFMPPVETTPLPPPPKPLSKPDPVKQAPAEQAKRDELRQSPSKSKPAKATEATTDKKPAEKASEKPKREGSPEREEPQKRRDGRRVTAETPETGSRQIVRGRAATGANTQGGAAGPAGPDTKRRRGKRKKKPVVSPEEIQRNVQKTLTEMGRGRKKQTYDRPDTEEVEEVTEGIPTIRITEFTSVSELAEHMDVKPTEVIAACLQLGLMVSLNQRLEWETIQVIADEFEFEVVQMADKEMEEPKIEEEDLPEDLKPRPPVVTVMGHVDHGKTSLLDYVRETNVIAGESGGITQHIGAYAVSTPSGHVTFLDTPGHGAFTAMRARGAQVTDVVVLVVGADDSVMPQTIEAINHAHAASVPIIVAINKIDLPQANVLRVKQQLSEHNVIIEEYGGKTQAVEISAINGTGIPELLEMLALETDMLDLKANPDKSARGVVVEARLDKGRGPVATVLVGSGTLKVGDAFLVGTHSGRVRALLDERGHRVKEAGPSEPVQILGFGDVPTAGDTFIVFSDEREAREIATHRKQLKREQDFSRTRKISLENLSEQITAGELKTLPVIVKGDVDGSVEALSDELGKLSNDEVAVEVIHRGVGAITESDVLLASASSAIIIGFHVRPEARARELAGQERVDIHLYQVIYEAIEDLTASLSGMLEKKRTEQVAGEAEIRELFKVPKVGTVAGCMVRSGIIRRADKIRVVRDGQQIFDGRIGTLRRHKDDAREVQNGFECGIWVENFNDVKVGDTLETYTIIEEARAFEGAVMPS